MHPVAMDTENRMLNILVLDDSPAIRNLLRSILKTRTNVFAVESPSLAFKILDNENIDILICDYRLPEMNGLKVLEQVKTRKQSIEVIMISDSGDMDTVIQALRNGAADFLKKPFSANELWVAIERTQKISDLNSTIHQVKRNNQRLKNEVNEELFHPIIGNSEQIKSILQQIQMVAQTPDTSVLIIGESGTGKELVARGIHQKSKRKDELFGAVNMSAVPESLFESEFFGHKKGSFTGAFADKAGWFETINNGTLFLDEIGEMSMQLQVKLLRVLEDRIFIKVGHQKEQKFDIRIVSATNKTLDELTGTKVFRTDLFHRLGTFIIHIPPLRERKDDIPILAEYLLKQITKKMGKKITNIDNQCISLLMHYDFPGNIRELKNLIERAVILCEGNTLLPKHFNAYGIFHKTHEPETCETDNFDLRDLEYRTILKVLKKVNYNKAEAARLLHLEWNALYRRIQKYEIQIPD